MNPGERKINSIQRKKSFVENIKKKKINFTPSTDLLLHHTDDERIEVRGIWITLET